MKKLKESKTCTKCGKELDIHLFKKDSSKKDGYYSSCKVCNCRKKIKEQIEEGYKRCTKCDVIRPISMFNSDSTKSDSLYSSCNVCRKKRSKEYHSDYSEKLKPKRKKYREENSEVLQANYKDRMQSDPRFRLLHNLRSRINSTFKHQSAKRTFSYSDMWGCSSSDLCDHIETTFSEDISWENYGTYWTVDHLLPCDAFDHTNTDAQLICHNWRNLRAMESRSNVSKGNKWEEGSKDILLTLLGALQFEPKIMEEIVFLSFLQNLK